MLGFSWPGLFTTPDDLIQAAQTGELTQPSTQPTQAPGNNGVGGADGDPNHDPHQQQLRKMTTSHVKELDKWLLGVIEENKKLRAKNVELEGEVKLFKAGRKEDAADLARLQHQIEQLKGAGDFAVVVLDFELDLFAPAFFRHGAGVRAATELRNRVLALLPDDADRDPRKSVLLWMFMRESHELLADLMVEGFFRNLHEVQAFIDAFNRLSPLMMLHRVRESPTAILRRQQALTELFMNDASCKILVVGRWAIERDYLSLLPGHKPPSLSGDPVPPTSAPPRIVPGSVKFDPKLRFIEPFRGTALPPDFMFAEPQILSLKGLVRETRLRRGLGRFGMPKFQPHILSPNLVEELRQQVANTPCSFVNEGRECPLGSDCLFAHMCPHGTGCMRKNCPFSSLLHPSAHAKKDNNSPTGHNNVPVPVPPPAMTLDLEAHARQAFNDVAVSSPPYVPIPPSKVPDVFDRHYSAFGRPLYRDNNPPTPLDMNGIGPAPQHFGAPGQPSPQVQQWSRDVASATTSPRGDSIRRQSVTHEPLARTARDVALEHLPDGLDLEALSDEQLLVLAERLRTQENGHPHGAISMTTRPLAENGAAAWNSNGLGAVRWDDDKESVLFGYH
ncbi:hypothetical protein OIO90_000099 [Microbotryomycetes sp. JL221]|nr:hypothetical protein OIO90_000099 [Microbotryomycetes sp. JL221]